MIKSYFITAWRYLRKNKIYSAINIFGLSIGLSCCMLITIYLLHETSYDKYHQHIGQLYQLGTNFINDGKEHKLGNTPAPIAEAMKKEYPEIEETARLLSLFIEDKTLLQYREPGGETKAFYESQGYLADASFFKLFTYQFLEGDPTTALVNPNTVVINEEIAHKFFGDKPALNKSIRINSSTNGDSTFTITGVFRPSVKPSQIDARFLLSIRGGNMEQFIRAQTDMIGNNMFSTFFLLKPGANPKNLEAKFPGFVEKYMSAGLKGIGFNKKQFLIPVKDIHLNADIPFDITPVGSTSYLYILGSIAAFTLLIACINFMNLSTARSSKRSSEVGIRKVLGAEKKSLISQFLGESLLMSCIGFFIALGLTKLLLPAFSQISGKNLILDLSENIPMVIGFFSLSLLTGLLAGIYPAFYLSSFQPVKVLKGKFSNSLSAVALRKGLVIFQFVISAVLIIASVVISSQMRFLRSTDLGFAKDQQIIIPLRGPHAKSTYTALKNEINKNQQVYSVGASSFYPGISNPTDMLAYKEGQSVQDAKGIKTNYIDETFLQTLDIKPVAGRLFSSEFPADTTNAIIINEVAANQIGFTSPENAIGKKIYFDFRKLHLSYHIVGVVKDFHFEDLHVAITPFSFLLNSQPQYNYLIVHARGNKMASLLKAIEKSWAGLSPGEPFEYNFLDENFQKNYESENKLSAMVTYFTIVAILISCLGLFGLATFSAEQRTREIGIRKVLGASVGSIVELLSRDFLKLVLIGILIACPLAWWAMHHWLQDFAYRIPISWTVFAITVFVALLIALATISVQAIRAALSNPVKNLKEM